MIPKIRVETEVKCLLIKKDFFVKIDFLISRNRNKNQFLDIKHSFLDIRKWIFYNEKSVNF